MKIMAPDSLRIRKKRGGSKAAGVGVYDGGDGE